MGKPKGKMIDVESRVFEVQKWLLDGLSYKAIYAKAAKWEVSERTVDRYIERAKKNWVAEQKDDIDTKRAQKLAELSTLKKSLKTKYKGHPAGIMAIARVENQIIKLMGLAAPIKVEHTGADGKPIQIAGTVTHVVDVTKLSTEALDEILKARVASPK